jgi:hypothetical protein
MRNSLTFATALFLGVAPTFAADQPVPTSTLSALGLSELDVISDAEGENIRGLSGGNGISKGLSMVSGLIVDPISNSFVFGSDVNSAKAGGGYGGAAATQQTSSIALNLTIEPSSTHTGFYGTIVGGAGGSAFAK